jgi:hypothetical protein
MYYAGFEICQNIRYRIFTGLAISRDDGLSFQRFSVAPILDRSDNERFFRGGPFVILDDGVYKLWYVAGSEWIEINNKAMPVYDLRYQVSKDGCHWQDHGRISMPISDPDEHGFGRPWIVKSANEDYELFYSIRKISVGAYRLGYATSRDGISWKRNDSGMGLDISENSFDSSAIMYAAVIRANDKTYCFYNGNEFGIDGFAVAELCA